MKFDLKFIENNKDFKLDFGEIQDLFDAGFESGFERGYAEYEALESLLIAGTRTSYNNKQQKSIYAYCFYQHPNLTTVDVPNVTSIGKNAFTQCYKLQRVKLPKLTSMGSDAFSYCSKLTYADIGNANIVAWTFASCGVLTTVVLRKTSGVCNLANTNAFSSTPIASGKGYIYVPSALVNKYKSATNWSVFANQIRAIEDYPEICGG